MDIQAALRDGYSKQEIMAELAKRTGMKYQDAITDGYSEDEVLAEMNNRDAKVAEPVKEETLLQKAALYVRPVLEVGGMMVGGALGTGAGPAGTIAGGAGGYAIGREGANLYDEAVGLRKPENLMTERGALNKVAETGQNLTEGVALEALGLGAAKGIEAVAKSPMAKKVAQSVFPKPTAKEAVGQVIQGKTKDLAKGEKALTAVNTEGSKTYSDLSKKFEEAIPKYVKQVDDALLKDPKAYRINELITTETTSGGKTVKTNFVQDALDNLKELYIKTKNPVKAGNIDEIISKANTQGLTKKEINDIAREYGNEYKAFNPSTGEPITSVNKIAYENTRKGLKEVARRGLDDTAKELDSTLSSILNTKRLIDKNVEAANRLKQKMDEVGLGQKAGRFILQALDYATLGTVKGALLKIIPKGMEYNKKNILELEKSLARNLKIINKERIKTGDMTFAEASEYIDDIVSTESKGDQVATLNSIADNIGMPLLKPQPIGARSTIPEQIKGVEGGGDIRPAWQIKQEADALIREQVVEKKRILQKLSDEGSDKATRYLSAYDIEQRNMARRLAEGKSEKNRMDMLNAMLNKK